jgi:hypothetical protein
VRRILIVALALLGCSALCYGQFGGDKSNTTPASGGGAPIWTQVNVQGSAGAGGAATYANTAFSAALTNPSIIVIILFDDQNTGATYTVTDTATNAYVDCGPGLILLNSSARIAQCFITNNTHTTASNVLASHISTGTFSNPRVVAAEWTGGATSSPIDGGVGVGFSSKANAQNVTTGANVQTATAITPVTSGDLIISMFGSTSTLPTAGTSPNVWTSVGVGGSILLMESFIQTTAASITATAGDTTTDNYNNITIAIK